jgi:hypothetical protein
MWSRAAVLIAALMLAGRAAAATPSDQAEALIGEGVKLRVEGRHAEALDLFSKAHGLAPSGRTLAQIGLAEGSLRRWIDAETHLAAALAAHDIPWIENRRNRDALEQALTSIRTHIGTLSVIGPEGAEVTVDGQAVGRLPIPGPIRLAEGNVHVRGSALGHQPAEVEVTIAGGAETTVTLDMGRLVLAAPIIDDQAPPPPLRVMTWKKWTGASLLVGSVAALVVGGVWLALDNRGLCDAPSGARCQWLYDTKTQGWIAIGVGAAAAAGGGLLLWSARNQDISLSGGPASVGLAGRF